MPLPSGNTAQFSKLWLKGSKRWKSVSAPAEAGDDEKPRGVGRPVMRWHPVVEDIKASIREKASRVDLTRSRDKLFSNEEAGEEGFDEEIAMLWLCPYGPSRAADIFEEVLGEPVGCHATFVHAYGEVCDRLVREELFLADHWLDKLEEYGMGPWHPNATGELQQLFGQPGVLTGCWDTPVDKALASVEVEESAPASSLVVGGGSSLASTLEVLRELRLAGAPWDIVGRVLESGGLGLLGNGGGVGSSLPLAMQGGGLDSPVPLVSAPGVFQGAWEGLPSVEEIRSLREALAIERAASKARLSPEDSGVISPEAFSSPVVPVDVKQRFREELAEMKELSPDFFLSDDELLLGMRQGMDAVMAFRKEAVLASSRLVAPEASLSVAPEVAPEKFPEEVAGEIGKEVVPAVVAAPALEASVDEIELPAFEPASVVGNEEEPVLVPGSDESEIIPAVVAGSDLVEGVTSTEPVLVPGDDSGEWLEAGDVFLDEGEPEWVVEERVKKPRAFFEEVQLWKNALSHNPDTVLEAGLRDSDLEECLLAYGRDHLDISPRPNRQGRYMFPKAETLEEMMLECPEYVPEEVRVRRGLVSLEVSPEEVSSVAVSSTEIVPEVALEKVPKEVSGEIGFTEVVSTEIVPEVSGEVVELVEPASFEAMRARVKEFRGMSWIDYHDKPSAAGDERYSYYRAFHNESFGYVLDFYSQAGVIPPVPEDRRKGLSIWPGRDAGIMPWVGSKKEALADALAGRGVSSSFLRGKGASLFPGSVPVGPRGDGTERGVALMDLGRMAEPPANALFPAWDSLYSTATLLGEPELPVGNLDLIPVGTDAIRDYLFEPDVQVMLWTIRCVGPTRFGIDGSDALTIRLLTEHFLEIGYGLDRRMGWNGMLYYGDQISLPLQPLRIETRKPPAWAIPSGWKWVPFCGLYPESWADPSLGHALANIDDPRNGVIQYLRTTFVSKMISIPNAALSPNEYLGGGSGNYATAWESADLDMAASVMYHSLPKGGLDEFEAGELSGAVMKPRQGKKLYGKHLAPQMEKVFGIWPARHMVGMITRGRVTDFGKPIALRHCAMTGKVTDYHRSCVDVGINPLEFVIKDFRDSGIFR